MIEKQHKDLRVGFVPLKGNDIKRCPICCLHMVMLKSEFGVIWFCPECGIHD